MPSARTQAAIAPMSDLTACLEALLRLRAATCDKGRLDGAQSGIDP